MKEEKKSLKFPNGFFTKIRREATPSKDKDDTIIPIKWSKKVLTKKKKAIVNKMDVQVINMCKVGDVIVIDKYISDDGTVLSRYSFVVIDDNAD